MDKRNLTEIRKSLIWSIPLFLLLLTMSIWSILYSLYQTVDDLNKLAPSVRITPFVPIALCVPIISITGIIIAIQKSVPCTEDAIKIPTRIFIRHSRWSFYYVFLYFCSYSSSVLCHAETGLYPLQYPGRPPHHLFYRLGKESGLVCAWKKPEMGQ
ncbi:hypothetical protein ACHFCA_14135 [Delftia tsuruhatensis]